MTRFPSPLPDFIPLKRGDPPLTADALRAILGPQVDAVINRIAARVLQAQEQEKSA